MATTDRKSATAPADAVAGRFREATFAQLLVRADGEALSAAGLLANACVAIEIPYQVSVVRTREAAHARTEAADEAATTVVVGVRDADAPGTDGLGIDGPSEHPSVTAYEAAEALGADPDPALALAGVVAGGKTPEDVAPTIVERADVERRSGLATPTADPADGLAHTTLAHVDYSGDVEATEAIVAGFEAESDLDASSDADTDADTYADADTDAANRRLASLLAIDAVSADGATDRAADAIERAIHPLAGGPLETIGGYADVLSALAATAPSLGIGLTLGGDADAALDAWREHARAAHDGVRSADTARHDGLLVAHTDGPVETVARLLRDFRSPEPAVLAIGDGAAALATVESPAEPIESAAEAAGGSGLARDTRGYAAFDADRGPELVDAVEEAL